MKPNDDLLVRGSWDTYRRLQVPADASGIQVRETERAFYAGALVVYSTAMLMAEPHVSDELAEAILEKLGKELNAYLNAQAVIANAGARRN